MSLTKDDVKRLADLARLELSDDETSRMERELDAVLGYVDRLQAIRTDEVEPHAMPPRASGWREDVAMEVDDVTRELVLSNFPSRKGDLLSVPAVFAKPKG
jgi:aspartyl-tRNA(Asn)/glutamyl-tRNA(Gln) amidotransferase subunit C